MISVERIRDDEGFGLVELLIAMTILTVAIMAIFAGFGSGALSLQRASRASTAATIADSKMEEFRRLAYSAITAPSSTAVIKDKNSIPPTPDKHPYWMSVDISYTCVVSGSTLVAGSPPTCTTVGGVASRPVKLVAIVVRDTSASGATLIKESSTFDEATGT